MHRLANPARFAALARTLTVPLLGVGGLLTFAALVSGLFLTPPDYLQGETVRIMYVHVPSAWLGMAGWAGIAAASASQLVWRHPLAAVAARALALPGLVYTVLCLLTGALWGRPTWGTYWRWDGRLTSMLVLAFLYAGYLALSSAERERDGDGRLTAVYGLLGAANLPIIHYSVLWWESLHQKPSLGVTGSAIAPEILWPLPVATLGFSALFAGVVLLRMRAELAHGRAQARLRRMAATA